MDQIAAGSVAVIFVSRRNDVDAAGYDEMAGAMVALAQQQPGYIGLDSVRDADGQGITISYWRDEASARAWHRHADHAAARQAGRECWYDGWKVIACDIKRHYSSDGPAA